MPTDNLTALVQGLPAEPFDNIYNLIFTASSLQPRKIDKQYTPPQLLRINQKSRALFAVSYYGNGSVSYVPYELLKRFLGSIPRAHCAQITNIRVLEDSQTTSGLTKLARMAFVIRLYAEAPGMPGKPTRVENVLSLKTANRDGTVGWKTVSQVILNGEY